MRRHESGTKRQRDADSEDYHALSKHGKERKRLKHHKKKHKRKHKHRHKHKHHSRSRSCSPSPSPSPSRSPSRSPSPSGSSSHTRDPARNRSHNKSRSHVCAPQLRPWHGRLPQMSQAALAFRRNRCTSSPIVGTSNALEKPFLRLTATARACDVRPLPVLQTALRRVRERAQAGDSWAHINEQLKSIRQDLMVQHERGQFAVECYQCHLRLALEEGDLNEANQCITQLLDLLSTRRCRGDTAAPAIHSAAFDEVAAYVVLHALYRRSTKQVHELLAKLTAAQCTGVAVSHALQLASAVMTGNWVRFFALYDNTPHMGGFIADYLVDRQRVAAFHSMRAAFRPSMPLATVESALRFGSSEETSHFLRRMMGPALTLAPQRVAGQAREAATSDSNSRGTIEALHVVFQAPKNPPAAASIGLASTGQK